MSKQPNLIYVLADQLRYFSCGYAGDEKAHTPNIDEFAAQAVSFRQAISGYPVCGPHRNSLFTGKYPSSTGMVINELRCLPDSDAIGHVVTRHGYETSYIGKWHLYGADHSQQFVPPGPYRLGFDGYWSGYNFNHHYYKGFYYNDTDERRETPGYEPDFQTDLAIEWLRGADRSKPFALFLNYGTPHDPWDWDNCPEEFNRLFRDVRFPEPPNYKDGSADRYWGRPGGMNEQWFLDNWKPNRERFLQVYYAMTANLDWNFGRLRRAIGEMGLDEDTIVVFTSDHGEMFGAQGRIAKKIFYEEAVRIPFLIRWKGHTPEGHATDACLDTPDIMPTLLELMNLPIPGSVEGMSLKDQALGSDGPEPEAAFLQGMGHTHLWVDGDEWRAVRDKRYTYAVMRHDRSEYLFDHEADPYEMRNLAEDPEHLEAVRKYRAMLQARMEQLGDTFEICTWYREHWADDRAIVKTATREPV
ncbi:sulfatase [Cohnella zeiphila]|uniref:Sulfatase n=1 Tax=Cohnella zeiphila TaxID=2761120 RepID=A0A7X0SNN4_9BACL|nr:sulfatase [Cohnella zeiphila]MBB6733246.1 sulfatase [Cohnella zeiphila]